MGAFEEKETQCTYAPVHGEPVCGRPGGGTVSGKTYLSLLATRLEIINFLFMQICDLLMMRTFGAGQAALSVSKSADLLGSALFGHA